MIVVDSVVIIGTVQIKSNNNVVKMFTKTNGLQSVYVSEGTKKKAAKNAVLQPLSICQVKYITNKNASLPNLKEAIIELPLLNIQMDVFKSTIALFIADFLTQAIPKDNEEGFYDFLVSSIQIFNEIKEGSSNYHLAFLLKMSKWLGIQPTLNKEKNNYFDLQEGLFLDVVPNHPYYLSLFESQVLAQFLVQGWTEIGQVKLTGIQRRKLLNSIIHYYIYHVPGFKKPKSLTILEEVFS